MSGLVRFAVERWQFSLLMTALVIGLGLSAFSTIPRTEDPQLSFPEFIITVVLPGATPQDIEQQIAKPIEDALAGLDNLREVRSTSTDGSVVIRADYRWGTDPEKKYDEVVREVNALRPRLPAGITRLDVVRARPTLVPIIQLALVSELLPMRSLEKLADELKDRLARTPGVAKAEVFGAPQSELRVALDTTKLAALDIPAAAVVEALRAGGADSPIGSINAGDRRFSVRFAGAYKDMDAVRAIPVAQANGRTVTVQDVATIDWATRPPTHITRYNGQRALIVTAQQLEGQDVSKLTRQVDQQIASFKARLPGSVTLESAFVQAKNVRHRLGMLTRDFVLAFVIVAITLLPLGWRAAGVVMIAIPISLLIGLLIMQWAGFSLNQLAVAGFVLSLGLLVDDAIVVIENVSRWLRAGYTRTEAAIGATNQIALAVLGCTACLMFAFLPLLALPEAAGAFIRSLPVAVLGTVAGSLIVALTLIPFAASRLLGRNDDPHGNRLLRGVQQGIDRFYAPVLHRALDRPWPALGIVMAIAGLAVPLLLIVGTSLFPPAGLPQFLVRIEMPKGTAIEATDAMVSRVDAILHEEPEIRRTIANAGRSNPQLYYNAQPKAENPAFGEIAVALDGWNSRDGQALVDRLRARLGQVAGAHISVITFDQGPPIEAPVAIRILGTETATLARLANAGEAALHELPELRDIGNPLRLKRTDLRLDVDTQRAAALGVPAGAVRQSLQIALGGATAGILRDGDGDDYPVTVRLPQQGRNEMSALDRIIVPSTTGTNIPLDAIARPALESGPAEIARDQRERSVTLTAYVQEGVLVSRATDKAVAALRAKLELPPGYTLKIAGEAESQARSFGGLLPAIITATFGILAVLVLEFRALRTVAVVAGVVPLGFFGAIAALWLTGNSLSFTASIGLIALIGIEIKNSILLVDFTEQLRRDGLAIREAVEKAGEIRFLPVLLTSVTAIGGLLPLAVESNGLYSPMAIAMIGGLITSTVLARIATPVMYLLLAVPDQEAREPGNDPAVTEGAMA
jgi:multidrug efflux pump subunit AcrB